MRTRRWLLFAFALSSLFILTWAGIQLAYSVPVSVADAEANPGLVDGHRAYLNPVRDPNQVPTHAEGETPALLAEGRKVGSFPVGAKDVRLAPALAYVSPGANGSYSPATLELTNVSVHNGTANFTLDVAPLAGGRAGWFVMGARDEAPRFVAGDDVLGVVERTETPVALGALLTAGALGFIAPLVAVVMTHRGAGKRGGVSLSICRECRAPLAANAEFCVRCGAYRSEGFR